MPQKIIIKISPEITVEILGDNPRDAIREAAFWAGLPTLCPKCGAPVRLFYRNPQDNSFWGLVCSGKVQHETNFGVPKVGAGLYYKDNEPWHNAFNQSGQRQERDYTAADEPKAEHERLDKLIADAWKKSKSNMPFADAVLKRFNRKQIGRASCRERV